MADAATAPEPARRSYAGATDAQRRGARRERLLDAGLAIIGTQGYSAATLRAVCAAAGLTERYFYESFANREALLAGVHARLVDELSAGLREAFAAGGDDAQARARAALTAFFGMLRDDPRKSRVLLFEMLGVSPALDAQHQRAGQDIVRLVIEALRPIAGTRLPEAASESMVFTGLVGAVYHVAIRWHLGRFEMPLSRVVESCLVLVGALGAPDQRVAGPVAALAPDAAPAAPGPDPLPGRATRSAS
jgi:AcrR family transcriptional regulator